MSRITAIARRSLLRGSGCMAALDAERFLEEHNEEVLS